MGLLVAVGITIQDIPENLATIIPLYCLNKKKLKSFFIVSGTAMFELFGFLLGYIFLKGAPMELVGASLAAAGGFMVYISLDELLPSAQLKEHLIAGSISVALGIATVLLLGLLGGVSIR